MVFADLNTIEHGMSSLAAGGGTFTSHSSPAPHPSRPSADVNPSSTISAVSTPSEFIPPTFDINDPRAILKTLIRYVMRTFYDLPKSLIIEYIFQHERIKQQYLADLLCIDSKQVRSFIQEFKRDKFIIEDHVLETNDGTTGRRHQDQYYYKIDTTMFINVVRYRLINMQSHVENLERQQTYKQSNYKCEQCSKEYTELDVGKLFGPSQDNFICSICDGLVVEDVETREESVLSNRQVVTMTLFNQEIRPLFDILQRLDEIMKNDLQVKNPSDPDAPRLNGNSVFNHHHPGAGDGHVEDRKPSDASNIFERMTNINHDIQIIIEKDDDDHYSHMDMDETSNTDSGTTAVRGPGKTGKKSSKNAQSTMEVASQPVSTKMKLANKKVPLRTKAIASLVRGLNGFRRSRRRTSSEEFLISQHCTRVECVKATGQSEIKSIDHNSGHQTDAPHP